MTVQKYDCNHKQVRINVILKNDKNHIKILG